MLGNHIGACSYEAILQDEKACNDKKSEYVALQKNVCTISTQNEPSFFKHINRDRFNHNHEEMQYLREEPFTNEKIHTCNDFRSIMSHFQSNYSLLSGNNKVRKKNIIRKNSIEDPIQDNLKKSSIRSNIMVHFEDSDILEYIASMKNVHVQENVAQFIYTSILNHSTSELAWPTNYNTKPRSQILFEQTEKSNNLLKDEWDPRRKTGILKESDIQSKLIENEQILTFRPSFRKNMLLWEESYQTLPSVFARERYFRKVPQIYREIFSKYLYLLNDNSIPMTIKRSDLKRRQYTPSKEEIITRASKRLKISDDNISLESTISNQRIAVSSLSDKDKKHLQEQVFVNCMGRYLEAVADATITMVFNDFRPLLELYQDDLEKERGDIELEELDLGNAENLKHLRRRSQSSQASGISIINDIVPITEKEDIEINEENIFEQEYELKRELEIQFNPSHLQEWFHAVQRKKNELTAEYDQSTSTKQGRKAKQIKSSKNSLHPSNEFTSSNSNTIETNQNQSRTNKISFLGKELFNDGNIESVTDKNNLECGNGELFNDKGVVTWQDVIFMLQTKVNSIDYIPSIAGESEQYNFHVHDTLPKLRITPTVLARVQNRLEAIYNTSSNIDHSGTTIDCETVRPNMSRTVPSFDTTYLLKEKDIIPENPRTPKLI